MIVHLIDGTYELFRHFYGIRRFKKTDPPFGAVTGVLRTIVQMLDHGATHIGVATDHVIESFRNGLWPQYKTGAGIDPVLRSQFLPLEEALVAMGVVVWPMIELDKDLAQCVVDDRVVQVDRRSGQIRDANVIRAKFGVAPALIPDYLALVGDSADGYPGIAGCGAKTAATLLNRYGPLEDFPLDALKEGNRESAFLFKTLATLRIDAPLFSDVEELRWRGAMSSFASMAERMGDERLAKRVVDLASRLQNPKSA